MASLASASRFPTSNGHHSPSSSRPKTNLSSHPTENASQARADKSHKQQLSITSDPSQSSQEQTAFPDLPDTGDDIPLDDSYAFVAPADLMSSTYVDSGFGASLDDFMTPDYSTDNPLSERTTPQEAIWEQQFSYNFAAADSQHPHILDSSFQQPEHSSPPNPTKELQNIFSNKTPEPPKYLSGAQLLSPQLTTPSPPGSAGQRLGRSDNPPQANMDRNSKKRGAESLQLSTDPSSLYPQQHGQSPNQRSVSPVIILSSHPQGDSPAHATPPRGRSFSRPAESPLHDNAPLENSQHYFSDNTGSGSRLMPPDYLESTDYDESDERSGVDPAQRGDVEVPTINQLADQRELDGKNVEVEEWLQKSDSGTGPGEARVMRQIRADRPRAHSTGIKVDAMGLPVYPDTGIPGPGALIDEDSDEDYSSDEEISVLASSTNEPEMVESPPVAQDDLTNQVDEVSYFPPYEDESIPPEQQEPHPRQFYRRGPWQDPPRGPIANDRSQPFSSNAAAMQYNELAAKWETASRAATWGTRRRLSESEVQSIVDGSQVRHLSLVKRGRRRGSTMLKKAKDKANEIIVRRSNSNIKKAAESPSSPEPVQMVESPPPRDSFSAQNPLQRLSSFNKSKSPTLDTTSAAHTGTFHGEPVSGDSVKVKLEGLRSPLQMLRKVRSKSDVGKSSAKSSPGLQELMTQHGGPPVMNLASPGAAPPELQRRSTANDAEVTGMDDDDEDSDETAIKMDLKIRAETIIPTLEGFKIHARQLNPRLDPYLIDRIGQEQVRRYKKLIDNRIKHARAVGNKNCPSKHFCYELGGDGRLLTPRANAKDPDATGAQFSVQNPEDADPEDGELEEGVVTPASFPPGIPLPPVKRLPAEFECFLCFKVKKFHKPSDWTKHVHEDVQPFSCTFPNCTDPKSFKRKADWVRHENERHRRLEYWKCSVQECSHICYRKDNFVQHLVREHKKTEPKLKTRAGKGKSGAGGNPEEDEVWQLVDTCRHETSTRPRDEPCKFCGNVLNSWKKLSVHMGKHMEQIAMPVLELANLKQVTADTIISPIEQNQPKSLNVKSGASRSTMRGPAPQVMPMAESNAFTALQGHMTVSPALSHHDPSLSPYPTSVHSRHTSSAGHSPAMAQMHGPMNQYGYSGQYFGGHEMNAPVQNAMTQSEAYGSASAYTSASFATSDMMTGQYSGLDTQVGPSYSSGHTMQTPISAQSMPATMGTGGSGNYEHHGLLYGHASEMNSYQQQYPSSSQAGASFHDGSEQMGSNQAYGMPNHYGQQPNMYYQR